jgi:hypothetical protein
MHYLTALLTCLLSMFGYQEPTGITSITRITAPGSDALFSKIDIGADSTTFRCLQSGTGRCFYRVFSERCSSANAAALEADTQCQQREVDSFALRVGQRRELQGLPAGFVHCVTTGAGKKCRRD